MIRHLLMWRDKYRFRGHANKVLACGNYVVVPGDVTTMHVPKVDCALCLLSLDILLTHGHAQVVNFNNGIHAEMCRDLFPYVHPPLGELFGIDAGSFELWRGNIIEALTPFVREPRQLGSRYVSAINLETRTVTISEEAESLIAAINATPTLRWSRKPTFIPVRRLDGRR